MKWRLTGNTFVKINIVSGEKKNDNIHFTLNNVCISLTKILFVKIKSSFLSINMVYG